MRRIRRNILKHLQSLRRELAASGLAFALLAGCGGGGAGAGIPSHALPSVGGNGTLSLSLHVPAPALQANRRSPKYVSPDTQYIGISYLSGANQTFTQAQLDAPQVNFAVSSPTVCALQSNGSRFCSVAVSLAPGTFSIALTTWAAGPSGGAFSPSSELSQTILPSEYIAPGSNAVPGVANIDASLDAIASNIEITALPGQSHVVAVGSTYEIVGTTPADFLVEPIDATGNIIIGGAANGAPTVGLAPALGDTTVTQNTSNPNEFSVQVVAYNSAPLSLVASATPAAGSGLPALASPLAIQTVQELWLANTTTGSPLGGIAGFALFPPTAGATGFSPPYINGDAIPIDSATCAAAACSPAQNLGQLTADIVPSASAPSGRLWALNAGTTPPEVLSYTIPTATNGAISTSATISPITPLQYLGGTVIGSVAPDANGNIWLLDSYNVNGYLEEYSPPSYALNVSLPASFAYFGSNGTIDDIAIPQRGPLAGDLVFIGAPSPTNPSPEILAIPPPYTTATSASLVTVAAVSGFYPSAFAISPDGTSLWVENGSTMEYFTIGANGAASLVSVPANISCVDPSGSSSAGAAAGIGLQIATSYNGSVWTTPGSLADGACEYQFTGTAIAWTNSVVYYQAPGGGNQQQSGISITP